MLTYKNSSPVKKSTTYAVFSTKAGLNISILLAFATLLMVFTLKASYAQEATITPLQNNPQLIYDDANNQKALHPNALGKRQTPDTLELPFFEDFSYKRNYPDDSLWVDQKVYINNQMAKNPPSFGFATFDGLGRDGRPYDPGQNNQNTAFPTDSLTSQFIDLSGYDFNDDIFLSFFYKPKGIADNPEAVDSLKLELKAKNDTSDAINWRTVWSEGGKAFYNQVPSFEPVNLNLASFDSSSFFFNTFQFRFVSYGNVSGNLDHWHVDYIELAKNRQPGEPTKNDMAVVNPAQTVLSDFRALPWFQVKDNSGAIREEFLIKGSNNDRNLRQVRSGYKIEENITATSFDNFDEQIVGNIPSTFGKRVFKQENLFQKSNYLTQDQLEVSIKSTVEDQPNDEFSRNDTMVVDQTFNNYLAYDDGTAEGGFGIKGRFFGSWQVAYKFDLSKDDSLRAIGMRFSKSKENVKGNRFDLMVWSDLGRLGVNPSEEKVLLEKEDVQIRYNGVAKDNFVIYELEEPIEVSGPFYVGWKQLNPYLFNIGLDKNYKELFNDEVPEERIFVNTEGSWKNTNIDSSMNYALMIRPYLSQDPIQSYEAAKTRKEKKDKKVTNSARLKTFPNPAKKFVKIEIDGNRHNYKGRMFNSKGKVVERFSLRNDQKRINVSEKPSGLYIITVTNPSGIDLTKKLLVK